ncbi:MAG: PLP-dependent decarboxylase, partial [Moorea sp. SIO4A3]|nr:PLP-dependent decarboxylase [Moorena sp. SIO4A3]
MIEFEKIINLTVDKLLNYLQENQNTDTKVIDYKSPQTLKEKLDLSLPENGVPLADLIPIIESYLDHSVRTSSHKFFNQLWGGFEITGLLAEMVTSTANTSMYTYEVAP